MPFKEQFQTEEQFDTKELVLDEKKLMVFNDEVNTFDWVIESLIDVCDHTIEQAEQCTLIIHYKGHASVRQGSPKRLRPMKEALLGRGISAAIE